MNKKHATLIIILVAAILAGYYFLVPKPVAKPLTQSETIDEVGTLIKELDHPAAPAKSPK